MDVREGTVFDTALYRKILGPGLVLMLLPAALYLIAKIRGLDAWLHRDKWRLFVRNLILAFPFLLGVKLFANACKAAALSTPLLLRPFDNTFVYIVICLLAVGAAALFSFDRDSKDDKPDQAVKKQ